MITNAKQHTLTFPMGITNAPSDMLSTDKELAECVNLTFDNGEIKPIQQPALKFNGPLKGHYDGVAAEYFLRIVFIHNFHNIENYICIANIDGVYKYVWFKSGEKVPVTIHDFTTYVDEIPDDDTPQQGDTSSTGDDSGGDSATIDHGYTGGEDGIPDNIEDLRETFTEAKGNGKDKEGETFRESFQAIGNTLIFSGKNGLYYYLWKNNTYNGLGSSIPEIDLQFQMRDYDGESPKYSTTSLSTMLNRRGKNIFFRNGNVSGMSSSGGHKSNSDTFEVDTIFFDYKDNSTDTYDTVQNAFIGNFTAGMNAYREKNTFLFPFWVRYAIRLYDGSHTHISQPILMLPSVRRGGCLAFGGYSRIFTYDPTTRTYTISSEYFDKETFKPLLHPKELYYSMDGKIAQQLKEWSDIISGIDIYVSSEIIPFYMDKEWKLQSPPYVEKAGYAMDDKSWMTEAFYWDSVTRQSYEPLRLITKPVTQNQTDNSAYVPIAMPEYKSEEQLVDEIKENTTFFLLSQIKSGDINQSTSPKKVKIKDNVLKNITNQSQLEHDDYFSHTSYSTETIFTYNNRLNLANVSRSVFEGFKHFMPSGDNPGTPVTIYVRIQTSSGTRYAKVATTYTWDLAMGYYFYYPDPRADMVYYLYGDPSGKNCKQYSHKLTEHPFLNGAYYLDRLPDGNAIEYNPTKDTITALYNSDGSFKESEYLPNQIFNTEANNPFVINAVGDNTIGNGKIVGLAVNTYALSQGQAGQHPLIVFTSEGIYAMSVATDGTYSNIFNLSREICNNSKSITETDGAIYFTTDKGLMVMVGVQIQLVSNMLTGKNWRRFTSKELLPLDNGGKEDETAFLEFLKGCAIAYDYKGSKLWIVNSGMNYHYVYNIKSKTFSRMQDKCIRNVVNFYPDTLMQIGDGTVYSFAATPDINVDDNLYNGKFVTRPLKFDGAMILERIHQIRNLFLTGGTLTMYVYGSNDLKNWNRLDSLTGKPWKYYTFEFVLKNWKAVDTYTCSVVLLQPERNETMR